MNNTRGNPQMLRASIVCIVIGLVALWFLIW
jgi:hypothetical protein